MPSASVVTGRLMPVSTGLHMSGLAEIHQDLMGCSDVVSAPAPDDNSLRLKLPAD